MAPLERKKERKKGNGNEAEAFCEIDSPPSGGGGEGNSREKRDTYPIVASSLSFLPATEIYATVSRNRLSTT